MTPANREGYDAIAASQNSWWDTTIAAAGSGNTIYVTPGNHSIAMGANNNTLTGVVTSASTTIAALNFVPVETVDGISLQEGDGGFYIGGEITVIVQMRDFLAHGGADRLQDFA